MFFVISFLKVKNTKILGSFFLFFIFLCVSLNSQNQDFPAYVAIFDHPDGYAEIGYVYLVKLLKLLGLNSHRYVLVVLSLLMFFVFLKIYKFSKDFSLFFCFYIVFLFPVDVVQIRNTFSYFGFLGFLMFFFERKYILAFMFFVFSLSFHYVAFIYFFIFLFSLVFFDVLVGRYRFYFLLFSVCLSFLIFKFSMGFFLSYDVRTLSAYYTNGKFSSVFIWGGVVFSFLVLIEFFLFKCKCLEGRDKGNRDPVFFMYVFIMSSLMLLPSLYYFSEFNRLYRMIFFSIIFFSGSVFRYLSDIGRFFLYFYIFVVFSFFGFYYSSELNYDWILFGFE